MSHKVIIIGGNAAGLSAASQIKKIQPNWQVQVYEQSEEVSYGSCGIPYFIQGAIENSDELFTLTPDKIRQKRDIELYLNHEVSQVDPESQEVKVHTPTKNKQITCSYDYLVIASGASPSTKHVQISDGEKVFTVRQVQDGEVIKDYIKQHKPRKAGVIGGGYIALELAETFKSLGISTSLIHRRKQLHRAFEAEISDHILEQLQKHGVNLQLNTEVQEIHTSGNQALLNTKDNNKLYFDMVVLATGVEANTQFLKNSGVELGTKNAVKVNQYLQTNFPSIYACGDVAETREMVSGEKTFSPLALKANKEGVAAGINIAKQENEESFPGVLRTSILKLFDMGIARTGLTEEEAVSLGYSAEVVSLKTSTKAGYYPGSDKIKVLVTVDKNSGRILGAQLSGPIPDVKRIDVFATLIYSGLTIDDAYQLDLAYAPPFSPVYDPVVLAGRVGKKIISTE